MIVLAFAYCLPALLAWPIGSFLASKGRHYLDIGQWSASSMASAPYLQRIAQNCGATPNTLQFLFHRMLDNLGCSGCSSGSLFAPTLHTQQTWSCRGFGLLPNIVPSDSNHTTQLAFLNDLAERLRTCRNRTYRPTNDVFCRASVPREGQQGDHIGFHVNQCSGWT